MTISVYDSFEQAQAWRTWENAEGVCIAAREGDKDPVLYSRGLTELAKKT